MSTLPCCEWSKINYNFSFYSTSVENLQNLLQSGVKEDTLCVEEVSGALPRRADTFGGYDSSPNITNNSEFLQTFVPSQIEKYILSTY